MTDAEILETLGRMKGIVDKPEMTAQDREELHVLYGHVEDVFDAAFGDQRVEVEVYGRATAKYPNYFSAGYLSGRTFHVTPGYEQLLTLIGKIKARAGRRASTRDEISISALVRMLQRFRECCQYLKTPPTNEKDIQDIIWIVLRSHFDRVDREDVLPRLGAKTYRPDFGLPDLGIFVEAKFIGERTEVAKLQEEILADIPGYLREGSSYTGIVVLVYDAAHKLRDARKFVEELRKIEGIIDVLVIPGVG
jgi:hypothetical protein